MKTFSLLIDEQQMTIIMQALADVKYRVSAPVIESLASQLANQTPKDAGDTTGQNKERQEFNNG